MVNRYIGTVVCTLTVLCLNTAHGQEQLTASEILSRSATAYGKCLTWDSSWTTEEYTDVDKGKDKEKLFIRTHGLVSFDRKTNSVWCTLRNEDSDRKLKLVSAFEITGGTIRYKKSADTSAIDDNPWVRMKDNQESLQKLVNAQPLIGYGMAAVKASDLVFWQLAMVQPDRFSKLEVEFMRHSLFTLLESPDDKKRKAKDLFRLVKAKRMNDINNSFQIMLVDPHEYIVRIDKKEYDLEYLSESSGSIRHEITFKSGFNLAPDAGGKKAWQDSAFK